MCFFFFFQAEDGIGDVAVTGVQTCALPIWGVSWLPLYHDMGLIGFVIAPIFAEVPVVLLPTTSFIRRPSSWLDAVSRYRGTITFAPNFAYALAVQSIST